MNCLIDQPSACSAVLDALPLPVFVVDVDVRIAGCNPAAAAYLGSTDTAIYHRRGGEVLDCIHATNGCGRGVGCRDCIVRQTVRAASEGHKTIRQKATMRLGQHGEVREVELWVTATPLPQQGQQWVLVVLEDVTELVRLRGLLPICAKCKRVRDSEQYWHEVTAYLHEHLQLDFTHGLCPECAKDFLKDMPQRAA